ncbi:protein FAR1-RELATED SEQUENCE 1-like [Papaver somniferum]|uniref:protein FAR1-RELATED SEQUENCE 1-like n=1 Tax=Papaver somniferum TaxID=3469 RepID=UPI000E701D3F|nr:protein FAR1-RELATED SEQUENCE 1-like [Papaver somniferum]
MDFGTIGIVKKYGVIPNGKKYHRTIIFDSLSNNLSCSCRRFEFAGFLCSHALKVLSIHNIKSIPTQYILKRWTKDVKSGCTNIHSHSKNADDPKGAIVRRYRELCRLHIQLATMASITDKAYEIAISGLNKTLAEVDASLRGLTLQKTSQTESVTDCVSQQHVVLPANDDNLKVKGIKVKEKEVGVGSSRLPNALKTAVAKVTRKRKPQKTILDAPSNDDSQPVSGIRSQQLLMPHADHVSTFDVLK